MNSSEQADVDHLSVRLIQAPIPEVVHTISVGRLHPELAIPLADAARAALNRDAVEAPRGWSTLWLVHAARYFSMGEFAEGVLFSCDGEDGGQRLAGLLHSEIVNRCFAPVVFENKPVSLDARSGPIAVRSGDWVGGPRLGGVRAVLAPLAGLQRPQVVPTPPSPVLMCPGCRRSTSPIPLLGPGMPAPGGNWELAVALGEAGLLGCEIGVPHPTERCRECAAEFIGGDSHPERVVAALLGEPDHERVVRVRARTLHRHAATGVVVWTPAARPSGGHWWFAVGPTIRDALDAAPRALIALRLRGGAVVIVTWALLRDSAICAGRMHIHVLEAEPTRVRLARGRSVGGLSDPAELRG